MQIIIPVAGYGTRLLPLTKVVSKELLPLGRKCLLQYAIEEALNVPDSHVTVVAGDHNYDPVSRFVSDIDRVSCARGNSVNLSSDIAVAYNGGSFGVILPDMYHMSSMTLEQMRGREDPNVVSVRGSNECHLYGTVSGKEWLVTTFQEKPQNYGPGIILTGRYLFRDFKGFHAEFSATSLGCRMHLVHGDVYDCGTLDGYINAWRRV